MLHRRTFLLTALLSGHAAVCQAAVADYETESSVQFRTADLLPADLISGPNYELHPVSTLSNGRIVFRIQTKWGDLTATGRAMLELRLSEMYAIERAVRMNRDPQLITSFLGTVNDSRKGVKVILTDPIGSVLRVPQAVGVGLNDLVDSQNRRSGGAIRRRVAADLDCDPETTNPILSTLLDWIAAQQGVGSTAGKVGLSLVVPGLGLVPASAQFKEMVATKQPSEINAELERELISLQYPASLSRSFCRESQYTTLQRLQIVSLLQPLSAVPQRDRLLQRVVSARSIPDGVATMRELVLLNRLQESSPIRAIADGRYLTAELLDRSAHLVCADDYLVLTESLAAFARSYANIDNAPPTDLVGHVALSENARIALMLVGIQRRESAALR